MSKTEKTLIPMAEAAENIPLKKLTGKQALFLRHLLDDSNPDTFMNATGSAKAAKYNCSTENSYSLIGYENIRKLKPYISQWLEEVGLSEERLKLKIVELLEVDNYPVQRATLEMAMRAKGMFSKENTQKNDRVNVYMDFGGGKKLII